MEPIKYKFFPQSNNQNLWIQVEFFTHNKGYGISFSIIENKHYQYNDGQSIFLHEKEIKRDTLDYWDNQLANKHQELSEVIHFLSNGDIRGRYAEIIIWKLFVKLYLHQGKVAKYFPEYYKFISDSKKIYSNDIK